MTKKFNSVFFSICFLAALLSEVYCIFSRDLFSICGIGSVVLITGFLLLDSVRTIWKHTLDSTKEILEKMHQEEMKHLNESYTELSNLQKATYSVLKKDTILTAVRFEELENRFSSLEKKNEELVQRIMELQISNKDEDNSVINSPEIVPIYDDPYKELSNEEIAKLFSSYGK